MNDPTCWGGTGILPFFPEEVQCKALVKYADEVTMNACNVDTSVSIAQEEVGIQRALAELPGCNPLFDRPGLPPNKLACPTAAPTPKIGSPSRLASWWNKDPRLEPRKMAVYDGFNSVVVPPSTTTEISVSTQGPASGTMYLTTGQNWDGVKENWSWNNGDCKGLTSKL